MRRWQVFRRILQPECHGPVFEQAIMRHERSLFDVLRTDRDLFVTLYEIDGILVLTTCKHV